MKNIFFLCLLTLPGIGHATEVLRTTDEFRMSWREISVKTPGQYSISVEAEVCAGESGKPEVNCVSIGEFAVTALDLTSTAKFEVKKNSDKIGGQKINDIATAVSKGMKNPVVRVQLELFQHQGGKKTSLAKDFFPLPSPAQEATGERKVLQEKAVLEKNGIRTRILLEVYRQ